MEIREYTIERTAAKRVPRKPLVLAPIGDIHYGDKAFDRGRLNEHLQELARQDVYFIGMGDMLDFCSPSNRAVLQSGGLYDTTREVIDEQIRAQLDEFLTIMKKSKGKWIGLVSGHHLHEFVDGTNTDQLIAKEFDCPYLGTCGMIRLQFMDGENTKRGPRGSIIIWVHHGGGGGSASFSTLTKLEKISGAFGADIYLMGHFHKPQWGTRPYIQLQGLKTVERVKQLVGTGSFRRSYMPYNRHGNKPVGSYEEKRVYLPTATGSPTINIWPKLSAKCEKFTPQIQVVGPKYAVPESA